MRGYKLLIGALFSGLTLIWNGGLLAQNVTISGHVFEEDGETKVVGATVQVIGTVNGGNTDENGAFFFSTKRIDTIRVLFRYFGQNDTVVKVVTLPNQKDYTIDMVFGENTGIIMGDQVITAGRHVQNLEDVVGSMEIINPSKVDLQASGNIEDALQMGSGVDIIDGQPNIRGSSGYAYGVGSRVMVMLDGLPLLSPDASFAQFDLIPTDNISQIEIQKGAASVLYGSSALGGVINVLTADAPRKPKTSIRLRGQLHGPPADPRLDWDGSKMATTYGIHLFHTRKIGMQDITLLGDFWRSSGWRANTPEINGRLMAMTKWRTKSIPGLTIGLNGSYRVDSSTTFLFWDSYLPDTSVTPFGSSNSYSSAGALTGDQTTRRQLIQRFTVDPSVKYLTKNGQVHVFRSRVMRSSNINDTQQSSLNTLWYNDYQYTRQFWDDRITLVAGGTATLSFVNGDSLYGGSIDSLDDDPGSHKSRNLAAYIQADIAATDKLNLTFGARYDHFLIDGSIRESSPILRAGANYEIRKGTNVRASFGQAFRSPSIAERFTSTAAGGLVIDPNPEIQVEKGWSAEVGIRQGLRFVSPTNKKKYLAGFVDLAGFVMDFNNMVEFGVKPPETAVFPPPPPIFQARNVADARIMGIEATSFFEVGFDNFFFNINGGVTWIDPVNLNGIEDSTKLVDLLNTLGPQDAPFTAEAFGMYITYNLPPDDPRARTDNPVFLKYRSTWVNRFSATVGYNKISLTGNYRYKSEIKSVDQFLFIAIPGSADFVKSHPGGFTVVDFIVGVEVIDGMKLSLNIENAFNEEYIQLPGLISEQRNFTLQWKYVF